MEGYSEPAPADLWEQLEKELDTVPKVFRCGAAGRL